MTSRLRITSEREPDGSVVMTVVCGSASVANRAHGALLDIEAAAFAPVAQPRTPTAHMPPYDTTHGGLPVPDVLGDDEVPLRAFTADECKAGGVV